jgi:hypothetical protein
LRTRISALGTESAVLVRVGPDGLTPQRTDAIVLSLSEAANSALVWQFDVSADIEHGGNTRVGSVWAVPVVSSGLQSRIIATAVCPGAVRWHVNAYTVVSPYRQLFGAVGGIGFFAPVVPTAAGHNYADLDLADVTADLGISAGVYPNTLMRTFRAGVNYLSPGNMNFPNPGVFDGPIIGTDPVPPSPLAFQQLFESPCYFKQIFGSNETASRRWIHIFDSAVPIGNGSTAAKYIINVPSGATFSLDVRTEDQRAGDFFFNGLVWMASSTAGTLTIDNAALINAQVQLGL